MADKPTWPGIPLNKNPPTRKKRVSPRRTVYMNREWELHPVADDVVAETVPRHEPYDDSPGTLHYARVGANPGPIKRTRYRDTVALQSGGEGQPPVLVAHPYRNRKHTNNNQLRAAVHATGKRWSLFDGDFVFPTSRSVQQMFRIQPSTFEEMTQTGVLDMDIVGGPLTLRNDLLPSFYVDECPEPEMWVEAPGDPLYEMSEQLTLRRKDGANVGWLTLTRYADVIAMPRHLVLSAFVGMRNPALIKHRAKLPYRHRSTDVLPHYNFVNFGPVQLINVPLYGRGCLALGGFDTKYAVNIISKVIDPYALMDAMRVFRDSSARTVGDSCRLANMEYPFLKGDAYQIAGEVGSNVRIGSGEVHGTLPPAPGVPSGDCWLVVNPEVPNPIYSRAGGLIPAHHYVRKYNDLASQRQDGDTGGMSAQIARAVENKFAALVSLMRDGALRNAQTTAKKLVREISNQPYHYTAHEIDASLHAGRMRRGAEWKDSDYARNMADFLDGVKSRALERAATLVPHSLDDAIADVLAIDRRGDYRDDWLASVPAPYDQFLWDFWRAELTEMELLPGNPAKD